MKERTRESNLWGRVKRVLEPYGMSTRVENIASPGMPDVLFMSGGKVFFLELKVQDGHQIKVGPFQVAWHSRAARHLAPWQDWFVVLHKEDIKCYTWQSLSNCERKVLQDDTIKLVIDQAIPFVLLSTFAEGLTNEHP